MAKMSDWIGTGVNLAFNIPTYKDEREKGKSVVGAAAKTALDFAFWEMLGPYAIPVMGVQMSGELLKGAHQYGYQNAALTSKAYRANFGGYGRFNDTQVAATMRQRGIQAMQQSNLQGYSNLGNEARSYFR